MSMASSNRTAQSARQLKKSSKDLSDPRAQRVSAVRSYSRYSDKSSSYATLRRKRARRKKIFVGTLVTVFALLIAGTTAAFGTLMYMNNALHSDIDLDVLGAATIDRGKPEDPFWMLLVGTDNHDGDEIPRSDSMILARIDPGHRTAALISIPRDARVLIPGYGYQKINAAYAYGVMEEDNGHSGPEFAINAASDLCGVGIAGYAQIDINGFIAVVDALGGVEVDVLMDISDYEAGDVDVYAGRQVLDGQHAIVFVRSRAYDIGDYQRQANQRVFLQALAKKILAADPVTIVATVSRICEMTSTNLDIASLAQIAVSMRGMQEYDIHTYSLPCYSDMFDEISYEVPDVATIRTLIAMIDAGEFPNPEDFGLARQGETPESYGPRPPAATDMSQNAAPTINTSAYVVETRNGYAIPGSATAVSDMLALAGYQQGAIGNANSMVYTETLIIYRDDTDRVAAEDIRTRLGYGRIIPSLGRYVFEGNILVVVGGDFR